MSEAKRIQMPPGVARQAEEQGFQAGIFQAPAHMGHTFLFNNSFFMDKGRLRMAIRRTHLIGGSWHTCMSDLVIHDITKDMMIGPMVDSFYPARSPSENIEDARVIPWGDGFLLGMCSWERGKPNPKPQQVLAYMDAGHVVRSIWTPKYGGNSGAFGGNTGTEKNWIWFQDGDGDLSFVYMTHPHRVVKTDTKQCLFESNHEYHTKWPYGHIRGGTPPIPWGDNEFLCFFHSSVPWKTIPKLGLRMKYFMGAYTFRQKPPHHVTAITETPILIGSDQDPMIPQSPAVVFPQGLVRDGEGLLVSFGVNDVACGWARIPESLVTKRLAKVVS